MNHLPHAPKSLRIALGLQAAIDNGATPSEAVNQAATFFGVTPAAIAHCAKTWAIPAR